MRQQQAAQQQEQQEPRIPVRRVKKVKKVANSGYSSDGFTGPAMLLKSSSHVQNKSSKNRTDSKTKNEK